ncbi:MAG: PAS domain S-box protein [Richelia sp. SM2_1_7]|nr:PAS domain S-box protein [Richelia sp. SM2_1_7]
MTTSSFDPQLLQVYLEATEIIQQGVMWLDSEGNILSVNSQFARELGYTQASFSKNTIFQVNPNTTLLEWRRLWKELLEQKQITLETEHITAKGAIYPVRWKGILIDLGGHPICCGIVENLLDVDRYHHLLRLTERAARTGSWEWDLIKEEVRFTSGLFNLLELPEKNILRLKRCLAY